MDPVLAFLLGGATWLALLLAVTLPRRRFRPRLRFDVTTMDGNTFYGVFLMKLVPGQRVLLTLVALDALGNAAAFDGDAVFTTSDEAVATVDPQGSSSAYVHHRGVGTAVIQATIDADLGEGVREIVGTATIDCAAGEAVAVELRFGTPEFPE
jgi:hypothetical protein